MATSAGFGKPKDKAPPKPPSKGAKQRAEAAQRYDKYKTAQMPEYEVYIRIQDKKNWFPVGAIAVKRSSQINAAIFANEAELLKGAFHAFPVLKKNQGNLEYGYRLKEFKDDPIELADRPANSPIGGIQGAIANLGDRLGSIFKRK
jgi:uncharacterized iron-regulated membrane protein